MNDDAMLNNFDEISVSKDNDNYDELGSVFPNEERL